jgi:hypothetical protein
MYSDFVFIYSSDFETGKKRNTTLERSEVLTAASMKMAVF